MWFLLTQEDEKMIVPNSEHHKVPAPIDADEKKYNHDVELDNGKSIKHEKTCGNMEHWLPMG